jgi:hypothetical protein
LNRIRSIKPEMRRNRKIADCGIVATLLSRELITYADDQGRFRATPREVKVECFPYHDGLKLTEVARALEALATPAVAFVELYEVDGEQYGWMPGWFRHQQLKSDRVTWSELPPPPGYRPQDMSKALLARWHQDAAAGELPARGDGSLVAPQGRPDGVTAEPSGSSLETSRNQTGDTSEPRARGRAGADRTGPDQDPERNGPTPRVAREAPAAVMPMPVSAEVIERTEALTEGCLEVLASRPLKHFERDFVQGWASTLRRGRELVPVDEILAAVRRKMAQPTQDGSPAANLGWCADDVAALARSPAASAVGAAGERLTPNSQLARKIEAGLLRRQGGATP